MLTDSLRLFQSNDGEETDRLLAWRSHPVRLRRRSPMLTGMVRVRHLHPLPVRVHRDRCGLLHSLRRRRGLQDAERPAIEVGERRAHALRHGLLPVPDLAPLFFGVSGFRGVSGPVAAAPVGRCGLPRLHGHRQ